MLMRNYDERTGRLVALMAIMAAVLWLGVVASTDAHESRVDLAAGDGAPEASGRASVTFAGGILEGAARVTNLPPQPFGSGRFYGVWFVRSDTGDKAFLGALLNDRCIILAAGGDGQTRFSATHFTTGPNAGAPISAGPAGSNVIVVLIENNINGLTPSPAGPVPGTWVAVGGAF